MTNYADAVNRAQGKANHMGVPFAVLSLAQSDPFIVLAARNAVHFHPENVTTIVAPAT
jgi:hypothetical protein